jgi:hypothetical protein
MPYALVASDDRLFAGLADGRLWSSSDSGESWNAVRLQGDSLGRLHALVNAQAS